MPAMTEAPPPDDPPVPGDFLERQVGHLLRRAYTRARRNSALALEALGDVSPVQAAALAGLADGPLSQADLGRRVDMEPANTHTLVKRMVAAGLAETRAHPANRRLSLVALTPDGAALARRLEPVLAQGAAVTLAPLSAVERRQLIDLLARVVMADGVDAIPAD
jgi:DNA-binding MarR family transcriptional regulator